MRQQLDTLRRGVSSDVATVAETDAWWEHRTMVPLVKTITEVLPDLKVLICYGQEQHRLPASFESYGTGSPGTHPNVVVLARKLKWRGVWHRLNPDEAYVEAIYEAQVGGSPNEAPTDTPANLHTPPVTAHGRGEPDRLCPTSHTGSVRSTHDHDGGVNKAGMDLVFAAGVVEMVDRTRTNDWSNDLSSALSTGP